MRGITARYDCYLKPSSQALGKNLAGQEPTRRMKASEDGNGKFLLEIGRRYALLVILLTGQWRAHLGSITPTLEYKVSDLKGVCRPLVW